MYAVKGKREFQEDCGAVIEFGDILVLAIADGFSKPKQTGSMVSQHVMTETLKCISTYSDRLRQNPEEFLKETFRHVRGKTKNYIAGSTLSLVIINKVAHTATLAIVGDSIVTLTDADDVLHIHPLEFLRIRQQGLTAAFGDRYNTASIIEEPLIASHTLHNESVVIVSSDGLYPVTPEDNIEEIEILAEHYVKTVQAGGTPQDLVNYASTDKESPDNITVALYKMESYHNHAKH